MEGKVSWALTLFFLSLCVCMYHWFPKQSTKQQGQWWWGRILREAENTKQKQSCKTYALNHSNTIQLLPTTLAHVPLYLSWTQGNSKNATTSYSLHSLHTRHFQPDFHFLYCHHCCYTCQIKARCTPLPSALLPLCRRWSWTTHQPGVLLSIDTYRSGGLQLL